jgi:pyrroloquinoline quinone biosynthesis protein B
MRARVLGAAAGGGFPQWNCGCPNCREARAGYLKASSGRRPPRVHPRTQDSLAVSGDGERWFLFNASPDIHRQIEATSELHPRGPRHSPIAGVVLTNGDLDHTLGLFSLRESLPFVVHATEAVWRGLAERNAIFRTLERFEGQVVWNKLELDRPAELAPWLTVVPFAAPGKLPVHLMRDGTASPEDNIGLLARDERTGKRLAYVSSAGAVAPVASRLGDVDTVLFDGTFWSSDELVRLGLSKSRAEDMAHVPIGGDTGSLAGLAGVAIRRRIFVHINNTNPILVEGSPERSAVERAGWEVGFDGMEVSL